MCHCSNPIMVENVGLLIFLRESASATAVPGAPRSSATPTKKINRSRRESAHFKAPICVGARHLKMVAREKLHARRARAIAKIDAIAAALLHD